MNDFHLLSGLEFVDHIVGKVTESSHIDVKRVFYLY